jgi:dTMP kinase
MYKNIASKNSEDIVEKIVLRSHPEDDNYFGLKSHQALLKEGKANKIIATIFYILDAIRSLILHYPKTDILIFSRYHLAVAHLPKSIVRPVYRFFNFILPTSKYMFYLDLSPEIAMERIMLRNRTKNQKLQSFENLESLRKIRQKANLISFNWIIVDASKDKNDIKEEIKSILLDN